MATVEGAVRVVRALREPAWYAEQCAADDTDEIERYGYDPDGSDWEAEEALRALMESWHYEPDMGPSDACEWRLAFKRSYAAAAARIYEVTV